LLRVWGRRSAFNVQKVMWLVGELELDHEHIDAGGVFGGLDAPTFLRMNPHGRVPVIDDGGTIVWESHTILRYLAARHGRERFWADDPGERSASDRWMDWSLATLQPAFMDLFWAFFRTPEEERDWPFIGRALERCNALYALLDRELAGRPYLAGEQMTLADVPAGTSLFRFFALELERPAFPNVEAWHRRLQSRSGYREHVMRPFEELRGRREF
jgi:glutathione S-transferase